MPSKVVEGFSLSHAQILDGSSTFLAALAASVAEDYDIYGVNDASLDPDSDNYENQGDDATLSRWGWLNFASIGVQAGYLSFPLISRLTGRPITTSTTSTTSEVQTLASSGASAGTFTLSFRGATTAPIAFNATNAVVQSALQGLSTIGANNVTVTGGPANTTALVMTFALDLANQALELVGFDKTGLTGAGVGTVTRTTAGIDGNVSFATDLWHEDSFNVAARPMIVVMPSKDKNGVPRRLVIGLYKVSFDPMTFDGPAYKDGLKVNYGGTALMSTTDEVGATHADGKKRVGRLLSVWA